MTFWSNFDKYILVVSKRGCIKKTNISELGIATRGTKGKKIQKIENDNGIMTIENNEVKENTVKKQNDINKDVISEISGLNNDDIDDARKNLYIERYILVILQYNL